MKRISTEEIFGDALQIQMLISLGFSIWLLPWILKKVNVLWLCHKEFYSMEERKALTAPKKFFRIISRIVRASIAVVPQ